MDRRPAIVGAGRVRAEGPLAGATRGFYGRGGAVAFALTAVPSRAMEIGYALEKVGVGMSILARHPGRIRERLLAAFTEQILFAPTEGKGIPDEVGRRLQAVKDQASRIPGVGNEGALAATFAVIDENEAEEIVGELEWIYYSLQSAREHPEEYGALGHARPELSRHRVASSR